MKSDFAINASNITKTFRLYENPKDRVKETFHPFRKKYHRRFHALSKVSFSVKKGETIGVVGRNGSGKSTLLQIICNIMQPSSGYIEKSGEISALLELGAGFHPEFTGRQNIFINCAIRGLNKTKTALLMPDIEAFADIGRFIDQPIRTYSKGMYIRLAFSIAISLNPDILVIDEILAVGDEVFRRKCYDRIREFQSNGVTVLVVSHNTNVIVELCERAILLDQGELILAGDPKMVVSNYQKLVFAPKERFNAVREKLKRNNGKNITTKHNKKESIKFIPEQKEYETALIFDDFNPGLIPKQTIRYESNGAVIVNSFIKNHNAKTVNMLVRGNEYALHYEIQFLEDAYKVRYGTKLKTVTGFELGDLMSHPLGGGIDMVRSGSILQVILPFRCILLPGTYFMNTGVVGMKEKKESYLYRLIDAVMFKVQPEKKLVVGGIIDFSIKG